MTGYIRKRADFTPLLLRTISYEIIFGGQSKITAHYTQANIDDFVIVDDFQGVIKKIEIQNGLLVLYCAGLDEVFNRPIYIPNPDSYGAYTRAEFITEMLTDNYKTGDPMYAMPYLDIITGDTDTPYARPDIDDKGFFKLSEYIKTANKRGLLTIYDISGEKFRVSFAKKSSRFVVIDLAEHIVTSEVYGGYTTARVTNYVNGVANDYYLLSDGTVTQDADDPDRVYGNWVVMSGNEADALKQFATTYGHEIEFISERKYNLYDSVLIRSRAGLIPSYISQITKKSGEKAYKYKAGELLTRASAILRR